MSVEAISWALNRAPVPADSGGRPSSPCKFVLVGLANHAGPDGVGAFPSVATLVRYTGLSERTVRTCLDRLEAAIAGRSDRWLLTAAQRKRLTPAVAAALSCGWTPRGLAEFAGANTAGIRNPVAVLEARLSETELAPASARAMRQPWCGRCDQRKRLLGFDGDAPRPCPQCKPAMAMSQSKSE